MNMTSLSRRKFLAASAKVGVVAGLASHIPFGVLAAESPIDIAVAKGEPARAVKMAVDALGGIQRFVKSGQVVVLKPNMSFPNPPEWGSTTHPDVVRAVAQLCLDVGAKRVMVLDYPLRRPEVVMRRCGIPEACQGLANVHVLTLNEEKFYQAVEVPQGKALEEVKIAKDVLQADVLINMPVAKSHMDTGVSFGMKNLMGLIWDREYFHQFIDLNQGIADLSTVLKPDLIIMDATRPMTTAGPGGPGKIVQLETIIAGTDPVAVDAYTVPLVEWYGHQFSGENVKYIKYAAAMGLGEIDVKKLNIQQV
jgi:uncharacterized protein (DUF362 family)